MAGRPRIPKSVDEIPDEMLVEIVNNPSLRARLSPADFAKLESDGKWRFPPHLRLLNDYLKKISNREIDRLAVYMPPRHGKSLFISEYFPAWYIATHPDDRVILASYEASFAASWGRKARNLLEEHGDWFDIEVSKKSSAGDWWEIEGHKGGMMTSGAGGPITGKGSDIFIIDDPIKNSEDANSQTSREKIWDWYKSTAYTRLEPGGAMILVQTRWHEDDLGGRIGDFSDEDWTVINFPAIAEEEDVLGRKPGQALWPDRYPLKKLKQIKATVGDYWWNAMYQQRPHPVEGGLLKREWVRYWTNNPDLVGTRDENDNEIIGFPRTDTLASFQGWDLAISEKETADYTVCCTGALDPDRGDVFVLDWTHDHMNFPAQVRAVKGKWLEFNSHAVGVETNAYQVALPQAVLAGANVPIKEIKRFQDKVTRITSRFTAFENGKVFLPLEHPLLETFLNEYTYFPQARHDDMLDATEMMLALSIFGPAAISVGDERYEFADDYMYG